MNPYLRIRQPYNDLAIYYSNLVIGLGYWLEQGIAPGAPWPPVRIEIVPIYGFGGNQRYARAQMKIILGDTLVAEVPIYKWLQLKTKADPLSTRYTFVLAWKPSQGSQEIGAPSILQREDEKDIYNIFSGIIWVEDTLFYEVFPILLDQDTRAAIEEKIDQAYDEWIPEFPDDLNDMIPSLYSAMASPSGTKNPDNLLRVWMRCDMTELNFDSYVDIAFLIDKNGNKTPVFLPGEQRYDVVNQTWTLYFDAKHAVEAAIDMCPASTEEDDPFVATVEKGLKAVQEALERFGVSI